MTKEQEQEIKAIEERIQELKKQDKQEDLLKAYEELGKKTNRQVIKHPNGSIELRKNE